MGMHRKPGAGALPRRTDSALASEDSLQDLIQVVRLVGKLLSPLSHFAGPFYNMYMYRCSHGTTLFYRKAWGM